MRLYSLLVGFLRLIGRLYFVDIRSSRIERVPEEGPVIIAANHPSSILDGVILSTQIRRPIHYLARSGLFRFPPVAKLFRILGAIPVYRRSEVGDHSSRNQAVFDHVFQLLESGGLIGVFPEGRNSPRLQVGQLRKGIARIALGAEHRNDFKLGLVIVPAGVNLEHREFLGSAALLRVGRSIRVADYAESYAQDAETAVAQLTEEVQAGLRRQAVHLEDDQLAELVDHLADALDGSMSRVVDLPPPRIPERKRFFKRWLGHLAGLYSRSSAEGAQAFQRRVHTRQFLAQVLGRAWRFDRERVEALRRSVERFRDHLHQTEVRQALASSTGTPVTRKLLRLKMTAYAVLMAPVALFGLIHNGVPYALARLGAKVFKDEAIRLFAYFGLGVISFGAGYAAIGYAVWQVAELSPWKTLIYLAALPPSGFVALRYRRNVLRYRNEILIRALFWNERELVELLRSERNGLRDQLAVLADRYGNGPEEI
ncbi:MAG: 1-acyl-sn-glycerol-3-phosphate acyltransferase [Wenzhouxiangella sp.]|jgi:1-acyl-sn-glycerol-3-phosphate acyltransferase|nr:1-acyl-sn-glycerol-3-phosphate acyltransferase [Wenzhouxiangella sp.]